MCKGPEACPQKGRVLGGGGGGGGGGRPHGAGQEAELIMVSALYFVGKSEGTSHFVLLKYLPGLCEESEWVQEGQGRVVVERLEWESRPE